jgi:hypothetical protein
MIARSQRISLGPTILLTAFLLTGLVSNEALADLTSVTFTASASSSNGGNGPIAASVTFTAGSNELTVAVTNTESAEGTGTPGFPAMDLGQGVSQIQFTFTPATGSGIGQPSAFIGISGNYLYSNSGGSTWGPGGDMGTGTFFSGSPTDPNLNGPGVPTHWGFSPPSPLNTAGQMGGGSPNMIFPGSGTATDGLLSSQTQQPIYVGTTTFTLTVNGMSSSTDLTNLFSHVKVGFGTSPDTFLNASYSGGTPGTHSSPPDAPEPSTMALAALGGLGFLGYALRRRLKK